MKTGTSDPRSEGKVVKRTLPWQFMFFLSSLAVSLFIILLKLFEII